MTKDITDIVELTFSAESDELGQVKARLPRGSEHGLARA